MTWRRGGSVRELGFRRPQLGAHHPFFAFQAAITPLNGVPCCLSSLPEPLVRAGGYGITSRGPTRFSGNDVGPPEHMD